MIIRRLRKRFGWPSSIEQRPNEKRTQRLWKQLQNVERKITRITGNDPDGFIPRLSKRKQHHLAELLADRCHLLNHLFAATPAEIKRLEQINIRLNDLTEKMYDRSAALYQQVLTTTHDNRFDDDVEIKGTLKFSYNDRGSVLELENDSYYGSNFQRMISAIDWIDSDARRTIEQCHKSIDYTDSPEMNNEKLGFKDKLNDGTSWSEYPFQNPAFGHICICHALHNICSHGLYAIPDLLRMNDFWCEITIVHQHIVEQDGARMRWWEDYSLEKFVAKLCTEAEHRPSHLRFGQFIVIRTAELFPEVTDSIWAGPNDCFNDDTKVEAYLRDIYDILQQSQKQTL